MGQVSSNLAETFIIWPLIFLLVEKKKSAEVKLKCETIGKRYIVSWVDGGVGSGRELTLVVVVVVGSS